MSIQVRIKDRISKVDILDQNDTFYRIKIDNRTYEVDITRVESGAYSLLYKGKSINMEMIEGDSQNAYLVNTRSNSYQVEIIDAFSRYKENNKHAIDNTETVISSPMPGKVVQIAVKEGQYVEKGDTVIIVSAMKMESEYKSPVNGTIASIFVNENDTIDSNQALIEITAVSQN